MKTLAVGELKANFSAILKEVANGHPVAVSYGRKGERVAVIVPYREYMAKNGRKLGVLRDRGECLIHDDFKLTDEELLLS